MSSSPAAGIPVVYLVDDEDVVRDALAWLLRSRRLLSEGYASADAFAAWLAEQRAPGRAAWPMAPACLVLDMRMPGMSGLALFERLADEGLLPLLPVIFLTGHGDVPTAVATVKRGAFDFVEKPFSNNALVDRIEQALQRSAAALQDRRDRGRCRPDRGRGGRAATCGGGGAHGDGERARRRRLGRAAGIRPASRTPRQPPCDDRRGRAAQ